MLKVYTKYDKIFQFIAVPHLEDLKPQVCDANTVLLAPSMTITWSYHGIKKMTEGLDGVTFVEYADVKGVSR